jgi:hypothetical protein
MLASHDTAADHLMEALTMRWTHDCGRLGAAALALALLASTAQAGVRGTPPTPSSKPYARLFTEVGDCRGILEANNLTGAALEARLAELTRWYVHLDTQTAGKFLFGESCQGKSDTTLAAKLTPLGAKVSNYRNGSAVSQASSEVPLNFGEASTIETQAPLAIGTFWAGNSARNGNDNNGPEARLLGAVRATDTTLRVSAAGALRPAGAPATWPFVASRGTGTIHGSHSTDTHNFVSWLRLDDEIAQIVAPPLEVAGVITLVVRRGIWGTAAKPHAAATRAMSPAYIGSTLAAGSDTILAGSPDRDRADYPLRYSIKIWRPDAQRFIADRIRATFGPG